MKRLILGVAAALLLSAGPAAADGMPTKGRVADPVAAAGPNWNGFYVGVGIGAGAMLNDVSVGFDHPKLPELFSFDRLGGEGIFGTVTIGYDRVIRPGWVAGIFADYDFGSNMSSDVSLFFGLLNGSIDHEHSWAIGGRLGFLTNPSTLLYATAGYTQAEFDIGSSETFSGYFVGAGVETFLRDNWTLKLEYRFSQFDEENFGDFITVGIDPSMHTARLVLSYKFGHPHH